MTQGSLTSYRITKRWTPLRPHAEQYRLFNSAARFITVPAGKRSGKTEVGGKRKPLLNRILFQMEHIDGRYLFTAPTHRQAKNIFWNDLKAMVPKELRRGKPSESELVIPLWNGTDIQVLGLDVPERAEGTPLNGIVLDEYADMKAGVWHEHIRASLADRKGWAIFTGVPEGRNHYYDLCMESISRMHSKTDSEWAHYHWISADILPQHEILSAKRDLDPQTYRQEYEATFETFTGLAYYGFNRNSNLTRVDYDHRLNLHLCFDFNVEPGSAVVIQEQRIKKDTPPVTCIIDEVHIPRNSNTVAVTRKLLKKYKKHPTGVYVYGDASGGNRGSAQLDGSDWELIQGLLKPVFGSQLHFRVPRRNGPERSRVNAVNSRLCAMDETRKMFVNPAHAPTVLKDFEGVPLLAGGSGEIDKSNKKLSHWTDAIGYYVVDRYPVRGGSSVSYLEL